MNGSAGCEGLAFVLPRSVCDWENLRDIRTHRMAVVPYLRYNIYVKYNPHKVPGV